MEHAFDPTADVGARCLGDPCGRGLRDRAKAQLQLLPQHRGSTLRLALRLALRHALCLALCPALCLAPCHAYSFALGTALTRDAVVGALELLHRCAPSVLFEDDAQALPAELCDLEDVRR